MKSLCNKVKKKSQTEYKIRYKLFESMLRQRIKTQFHQRKELTVKNSTQSTYEIYNLFFFSCLKNYINPFSEFF